MSKFKDWVRTSREEQRRAPQRYLASYPELVFTDSYVWMTEETYRKIEQSCGRYDGCLPTGQLLGKMFLRGMNLCWFGISKVNPSEAVAIRSRRIVVVERTE